MIDVQANNWILPIKEDPDDLQAHYVKTLGLKVESSMTKAVIFDQLNRAHWFNHFCDMTAKELLKQCKQLGLDHGRHKATMVDALIRHYQKRVTS